MPCWFLLIICSSVANRCAAFFNDTVKFWGQLENSASLQCLVLRAALTANVTKATVGINTHGGHDGHRSVWHHSQPDKTGLTDPRQDETYSTVGTQSDSATRWLEVILHAPMKKFTQPGGRHVAVMSFRMTEVRRVCHGCKSGGQLGYSKAPECGGGVAIIYLRQWQTHTCLQSHTESPVVYMHYVTGKCGTVKMIISMSYIKLLQSQLY